MARPIQLWIPDIGGSLLNSSVFSDVQRAYLAWRGETSVWLLPEPNDLRRWTDTQGSHVAVAAAFCEHVCVYHVGENGYVYGRGAALRFPDGRVDSLLSTWLNAEKLRLIQGRPLPSGIQAQIPRRTPDGVRYEEVVYPFGAVQVPPIGTAADSETQERYVVWWMEPLTALFPLGSDFEPLRHLAAMQEIVQVSANHPRDALKRAQILMVPYVQEGYSRREDAWFLPTMCERGKRDGLQWVVREVSARAKISSSNGFSREFTSYGLRDAASIDEVLASPGWHELLREEIPVRRAWGPIGLFWALLLNDLEQRVTYRSCERCGWVIRGRHGKRLCGPDDNGECYRGRRRQDQRRSRDRRTTS
jgi:hypothetical protein